MQWWEVWLVVVGSLAGITSIVANLISISIKLLEYQRLRQFKKRLDGLLDKHTAPPEPSK
jgi:hypothetical protein